MALTKIDDRGLKTPIDLLDNEKIRFGTGNDLEIYHNGSSSYLLHNGDGNLVLVAEGSGEDIYIKANDDIYLQPSTNQDGLKVIGGGSVQLYYDNSEKIRTESYGLNIVGSNHLQIGDNGEIRVGNSGDLKIFHDGSHNRIDSTNGNIYLRHGTDNAIKTVPNGTVELYYDDSKKLNTESWGVQVTGTLQCSSHFNLGDNDKIKLGDGEDLQIYSDGTNGILEGGGSGANAPIFINGNTVRLQTQSGGEKYIDCQENGAVELYYNNSKKLETITEGTKITGQLGINMTPDTAASSSYVLQLNSGQSQCCLSLGNTNTGTGVNNGLILSNDASHAYLYNRENTSLLFGVNDDTKFKMETNGNFEIVNGDLKVASGHGIDFSATSDATGKTSELFDDYEEGTFTPSVGRVSGSPNVGYAAQDGYYTKTGRVVHFFMEIRLNSWDNNGASASVVLNGLPFTAAARTGGRGGWDSVTLNTYYTDKTTTAGNVDIGVVAANNTRIELYIMGHEAAYASQPEPDGNDQWKVGGYYFV